MRPIPPVPTSDAAARHRRCSPAPAPLRRLRAAARRFGRSEDGSMVIFGLFVALIIFMSLGLAVDAMNAEYRRTKLQSTLDSAVLAAADLDQPFDAEEVVESYFTRAGLAETLDPVPAPVQTLNSRTVSASASQTVPTSFLQLVGIDSFDIDVQSTANETIPDVEISLVLDISGSMRFGTSNGLTDRIGPLRDASKDFARTVLRGGRANDTTISVVPYAGQVNPGAELFAMVGGARRHGHSECLVLGSAEFSRTGLPSSSARQVPHFMSWSIDRTYMDWGWCPQANSAILPFSSDVSQIEDYVDGLRLYDGTGTHIGMKWGLALLDPTSRDEVASLRGSGLAGPVSDGRPYEWDQDGNLKVIVLMTDGNITEQISPLYDVPVFWHGTSRTEIAVLEPNAVYRALHDAGRGIDTDLAMLELRAALLVADPYAKSVQITSGTVRMNGLHTAQSMLAMLKPLTAEETARLADLVDGGLASLDPAIRVGGTAAPASPPGIALIDHGYRNLTSELDRQRNHLNQSGRLKSQTSSASSNRDMFTAICAAAKAHGVVVYTVAFEASSEAQSEMRECATADSHYFDVRDAQIATAFRAIASQINQLRLMK